MGTELMGCRVEDDNLEVPSIPPGFETLASFTFRSAQTNLVNTFSMSAGPSGSQSVPMETDPESNDNSKTSKPLRRRTGVKYNQFDSSSDDDSECKQVQDMFLKNQLPKGVIRGCEGCKDCQKVTAKWHPDEARRPVLEEAPVFYPSEEEFEDTLKYISSIRPKAEVYGICRIVPPPSWKPPCPLKEKDVWERSRFTTRVQRIDKLQNRHSMRKILQISSEKRQKKKRCLKNEFDIGNGVQNTRMTCGIELHEAERFGFEAGPEFSLDTFQKYADDFKTQYFRGSNGGSNLEGGTSMLEDQQQPSVEEIEGEYWRMVEKPTEEIEVLYGADLETGSFGSGFPKNSQQVSSADEVKYIQSGWNLNNFPRLPGSVLSFESSDISGVLVPWLYVGMCFSSFCWHVEDHHLYSLNYMHWGAPKMWYGVSGSDALKLEAAMRKHLPDLFEEQPDLLHKLVTQISPSILRSEGVPVYRCVQNPGDFVLTFPRAYHAGFNCGFNCAEAVNVAPVDWLPHGQKAIELYREQGRQTSISHDKLLLGAAREAVKANWEYNLLRKHTPDNLRWKEVCGKEGVLSTVLKVRVEMERMRREMLCKSSQALKMESSFDANSERECSVCLFDLHLSAAGCHHCSPDKYACLNHARQLCTCSWGAKFFLFRYDINELNLLVEALEGKLSAVYRWAKFDLGLALSSYVSKEKQQVPGLASKSPHPSHGVVPKESTPIPKETTPVRNVVPAKDQGDGGILNPTKHVIHLSPMLKAPVVVLALENVKPPSNSGIQKGESSKHHSQGKKESFVDPRYQTSSCPVSEVNSLKKAPFLENSALQKCDEKPASFPDSKDVILLSDDEGDKPSKESPVVKSTSGKPLVSSQNPISTSVQKQVLSDNQAIGNNIVSATFNADPSQMLGKSSSSLFIKVEDISETGRRGVGPPRSCVKLTDEKQPPEENVDCGSKQPTVDEKPKIEDGHKDLDPESRSGDNIPTAPTLATHSNNLDRYYRQKGPRIAKVVRRINCNVELLDFGTVNAGKLWCDSRAIYPKGFRSKVKYIDVVDPTNMCYYVSEILDAGRDGPLFMVSVEHCPSEVFIHTSAGRCWEMVRDRVNHEIAKQHKLGRAKLPPLQPPGSLDGLEMFGFSSPTIVQAIQAMDKGRVCTEYWKSRPLMQITEQSPSAGLNLKSEPMSDQDAWKGNPRVERILSGLFKKANEEELRTLYSILYSNKSSSHEQSLLTSLLNEEITKQHPR